MSIKFLRILSLNETSHAMLFWDAKEFRWLNQVTCRKLEAMCNGSEPVRRFSLTRALARKGMRAKTEMSPVSWFWLRSRFCSTTKQQLLGCN